ncbi:MAG: DNA polymerase III subunit alpha [Bacteroidales bacterium]
MKAFVHLHLHSQYSVQDGAGSIDEIVARAVQYEMPAVALTDHGVMTGIKDFHGKCKKAGIKPILGCEAYISRRDHKLKSSKEDRYGRHLVILAKNKIGYQNLLKLTTEAALVGDYYRPRVSKEYLAEHKEGLIVLSACLGGVLSDYLKDGKYEEALEDAKWYKETFGDDFYVELQRHENVRHPDTISTWELQKKVNPHLIKIAKELNIKMVATNDVHFVDAKDVTKHDILVCLSTGKKLTDEDRLRYTGEEWLKSGDDMLAIFDDMPELIDNTVEIAEKVEVYELNHEPIMPMFKIPEDFGTEDSYKAKFTLEQLKEDFGKDGVKNIGEEYDKLLRVKLEADYLRHLTFEGAKRLYPEELDNKIKDAIDFELDTIKTMGYPGYFLIVSDFINEARRQGTLVGPGRGSAAGSVVAYCTGITTIDPIAWDLLFERFLNPDRVSLPDIDVDFDDKGREDILRWVQNKYGVDKVSAIGTVGTMAAKMSIKDVARVLDLPIPESNRLAKLVPDKPVGIKLKNAYNEILAKEDELGDLNAAIDFYAAENANAKKKVKNEEGKIVTEEKEQKEQARDQMLFDIATEIAIARANGNEVIIDTLKYACNLEGCVRGNGVHACGVIISKTPIVENSPLAKAKDSTMPVTQYDGHFVEDVGLIKMDFLGLKTMSIIKETLNTVKLVYGEKLDINNIPLDDKKTFQLFGNGDTTGVFQFESDGMKKYLRILKPSRIDDLVAMNALYRPGPMDYIPNFVDRKHGKEPITYDHPLMERYLKDTYGVTVYQEQVMLLSRELAGFTRGDSDVLRKAMGKKMKDKMAELKVKFVDGCLANPKFMSGCKDTNKKPEELIEKIWTDWEAFASYAFNKSHSVCYADIAYRCGYLKANYPEAFMSAILTCNFKNADKVSFFMDECNRMDIPIEGCNVNKSHSMFIATPEKAIAYGLAGIKSVGEKSVDAIVEEREKYGKYKDVYDFVERVDLKAVTKAVMKNIATVGGFDCFEQFNRRQFIETNAKNECFADKLHWYGTKVQEEKNSIQLSLFGDDADMIEKPQAPKLDELPDIVKLNLEKELAGVYMSAHPLDKYKVEIDLLCTKNINLEFLSHPENISTKKNTEYVIAAMVIEAYNGHSKNNKPFIKMTLADKSNKLDLFLNGRSYEHYARYAIKNNLLLIKCKPYKSFRGMELGIEKITLLQEGMTQACNRLIIDASLDVLDKFFIEEFGKHTKMGNTPFDMTIYDVTTGDKVSLETSVDKIDPSNELLIFLNKTNGVKVSIDKK